VECDTRTLCVIVEITGYQQSCIKGTLLIITQLVFTMFMRSHSTPINVNLVKDASVCRLVYKKKTMKMKLFSYLILIKLIRVTSRVVYMARIE